MRHLCASMDALLLFAFGLLHLNAVWQELVTVWIMPKGYLKQEEVFYFHPA